MTTTDTSPAVLHRAAAELREHADGCHPSTLVRMRVIAEPQEGCGHPIDCIPDHEPSEASTVRCGWCVAIEAKDAALERAGAYMGVAHPVTLSPSVERSIASNELSARCGPPNRKQGAPHAE